MATKHLLVPTPHCFFQLRCRFFQFIPRLPVFTRTSAAIVRACSAAIMETRPPSEPIVVNKEIVNVKNFVACSICYGPLTSMPDSRLSGESTNGYHLQCDTCKKSFIGGEMYLDLTVTSGVDNYGEVMPLSTQLFRTGMVSFLYERGWRQSFRVVFGFPGPEKEFEMIKTFMTPVLGGTIIDASCASGLFSRIFAKSELFSSVVALDYSENMLKQCYEFIKQEKDFPKERLILVRADISRLPFASSSIDAVHAGAALHCWPSPSAGVAEISRVLRPGGVFVASTYILDGPFSLIPFLGTQRERMKQITGSHVALSERELEELCMACGLVDFKCIRNRNFIMLSATKPS